MDVEQGFEVPGRLVQDKSRTYLLYGITFGLWLSIVIRAWREADKL